MNKTNITHTIITTVLFASLIIGCGKQASTVSEAETPAPVSTASFPEGLLSSAPLSGAVSVVDARKSIQPDTTITVTGYVGGREEPLVEQRAILTLADTEAMPQCGEDECKTPWDACCVSSEISMASIASVQVLDVDGTVLKQTLSGFGGIKPGSAVTVQGKISPSSSDSVLIVNAEKIHVLGQP